MNRKKAVILVNLGTPESATEAGVKDFLKAFLMDRRVVDLPRFVWWPILNAIVLPLRAKRVAHAYQQIWMQGGSPLKVYSLAQQQALQTQLGDAFIVELAMTYGEPSLNTVWGRLKQQQVTDICLLPLYPQYSSTTTAPVFDAWNQVMHREHALPSFTFVSEHYQLDGYISALADSVNQSGFSADDSAFLLFSFHGIPENYANRGDPYPEQCHQTAKAVAEKLGLDANQWRVTFQSRFGKQKWLEPYTDVMLEKLPSEGKNRVYVISPAFSVDCLETLEEIAMQGRDTFIAAGGALYTYVPALNDHTGYIQVLADIARKTLN